MRRIAVLTSSRADYGIYKPLLEAISSDGDFHLSIIAFGTHLSHFHGYTLQHILEDGFAVTHTVNSMLLHDDANAVATAAALTSLKFADFWSLHAQEFDLVFCLGDRYEMFAAVSAGIPFNIPFAHLHGGETTLGAIDNTYRHAITLASRYHFTSCKAYSKRVAQLMGSEQGIYTVGALSLDNLRTLTLEDRAALSQQWGIAPEQPFVLLSYHPETLAPEHNIRNMEVLAALVQELQHYTFVVSLPNADTYGNTLRQHWQHLKENVGARLLLIENFGTRGYFSCMQHCAFLLGNSSSGIIEAASLHKWVINIGTRQQGRLCSDNVLHAPVAAAAILEKIHLIESRGEYKGENIYDLGGAAEKIIEIIRKI